MSNIKVKEYLKKYNMDDKIITLEESTATVALAAEHLGCKEEEIAKTLSFSLKDKDIVIVMAGDKKIDNAKYRNEFGEKARMISADEVENRIGHPVGGVCPFAVKENVKIYLDESLKKFTNIYPACGSSHTAIKISLKDLQDVIDYTKWIDVCK